MIGPGWEEKKIKLKTRQIVIAGMLGAISIILGATGLGLIPVPTPAGHVTIMHLPAILGGIIEGPAVGLLIGLIFGVFSFLRATNPIFADPLIAILPRLFIGVAAYYSYRATLRLNQNVSLAVAGVIGTVVNTAGVLTLAVLRGYLPMSAALAVAGTHGIPEAVIAALFAVLLGRVLINYQAS
ncbi:ECF transporter S component [Halanaerobium hydrogeniformans]|uniref:Membrane protein n=1 Tax=Halanaerobium hydrogeniformans TaxID=656519 RepID=E4RMZ6_HALHG|nr:membrane protein [Halanaerobium hydrogeniformans]